MKIRIVKGTTKISSKGDIVFHTFGGDMEFNAGQRNIWYGEMGNEVGDYEEYVFNGNDEREVVFIYLLFYIDEDHKGKYMISEACQTRLKNIKRRKWYDNEKYRAFCIPLQRTDEILDQIPLIIKKHSANNTKRVVIAEIGFFSHAGGDGPICYNTPVQKYPTESKKQMTLEGWGQISVEWAKNAKCVFYGCNTGNTDKEKYSNFAENISNLSNFKDVEIWGQSSSSFPSFYPHYRVTSVARSIGDNGIGWDFRENTYQVAGGKGEGKKALSFSPNKNTLTDNELKEGGYPEAKNFNIYKNGVLIKSTHQGVFNNHR